MNRWRGYFYTSCIEDADVQHASELPRPPERLLPSPQILDPWRSRLRLWLRGKNSNPGSGSNASN